MKGTVYAIRSHQTKDIYIGSTTQILCKRFSDHKVQYKRYIEGKLVYCCTSFEIIQYNDAYIELIELVEFNEKCELTAREGFHIRNMDCVNKRIEGRTKKDYNKQNYIDNKEQIKQYRIDNREKIKQYRIDNKEKMKQYRIDNREKINQKQRDKYQLKKEQNQIV